MSNYVRLALSNKIEIKRNKIQYQRLFHSPPIQKQNGTNLTMFQMTY